MSIDYTQQKLWEAMNVMVGAGDLQERLKYAGTYLAALHLHEPAFPALPELEARLKRLLDALKRAGALSDEDAEQRALEILSLFCEATRAATTPVGATETVIRPNDRH